MLQRLLCMLIKEFLQMLRDPRMRVVIFGVPVIQMTIMAFALTTDVTEYPHWPCSTWTRPRPLAN
jgi:ABC-2 type transport system permease protein